jgi:hypothetical protein
MSIRGIDLSTDFVMSLHKELLVVFRTLFSRNQNLTVFQLYGFGNYDDKLPNLKTLLLIKLVNG